jgi:ADP-ribose pyrophosphatase YjhB (NUDIX family)
MRRRMRGEVLPAFSSAARGTNVLLRRLASAFSGRTDIVTLGVQGIIVDDNSRVLLVRHGYRPGWHFPGGGVEPGEKIEHALSRELLEETGLTVLGDPKLLGIYSNFGAFPGDHIVLFVVDRWQRGPIPPPNREIVEQAYFPIDRLPGNIAPGAARRLDEVFRNSTPALAW